MPIIQCKSGFYTKIIIVIAMICCIAPDSFGRESVKLYSIGNNLEWNSVVSWSLTANGPSAGIVPQGNDTIVVNSQVIQNIDFSFFGHGLLSVTNTGILRANNMSLVFSGNSKLECNGEIKVKNLNFSDNASLNIEENGLVTVSNSFSNISSSLQIISGKLSVTGNLLVASSMGISGTGSVASADYTGQGVVFGISPVSSVPKGSLISENNWIGTINNEWDEPLNWSSAIVPSKTDNISILASNHNPEISTNITCGKLYINSEASLSVNPGAFLEICG